LFILIYFLYFILSVRPEAIAFGAQLYFAEDVYFLFRHSVSELRRPIAAKFSFCTMISNKPNFITQVKNFAEPSSPKNRGQKHAKFGSISHDFKIRRRISPERICIFQIGQVSYRPRFFPRSAKKVRWTLVQ